MNKHIVKNDDNKPFHSSGYAQVANGNRVGSTSTVSFERRQQIEQNRQKIAGYNRSVIGRTYSAVRAKSVANKDITNRIATNQRLSEPVNNTPATSPQRYNPYA